MLIAPGVVDFGPHFDKLIALGVVKASLEATGVQITAPYVLLVIDIGMTIRVVVAAVCLGVLRG